jgi:hypothetical protein
LLELVIRQAEKIAKFSGHESPWILAGICLETSW